MKYYIEVAEKYGKDNSFKPETTITGSKSFSRAKAHEKRQLMQRYTNSLTYKVVRDKLKQNIHLRKMKKTELEND